MLLIAVQNGVLSLSLKRRASQVVAAVTTVGVDFKYLYKLYLYSYCTSSYSSVRARTVDLRLVDLLAKWITAGSSSSFRVGVC